MDAEYLSDSLHKSPFLLVKDGVVVEVSQQLIHTTEFSCDKLLNKSIEDVFKTLRVGPDVNIYAINKEIDYFMFTKSLEVRLINIEVIEEANEKMVLFKLKPDSNFEVKFPFINKLCSDNYDGIAIFSLPDITLLKANETFVSFFDKPFNKLESCIGKRVSEFVTGFEGSTSEKIWMNIIETGQTFYTDEYMFDRFERGITYWKSTLTPIYDEGKLKYCVEMTKDITEQVLQRKKIEEQTEIIRLQNEKLKWQADLLNLSSEAIFTWKLDGEITYWNNGAEQLYGYDSQEALGRVSHDLLKTVHHVGIDDIECALEEDGIWRGLVQHTCKDGRKVVISTSHQVITKEHGQKIVLEINRDVTEVKMMEQELRQQKNELEEIIQSIDDALFIYDDNKKFYLVNKAAKELYKDNEFSNFEILNTNTPYKYYDENGDQITKENLVVSRVSRGEVVTNYKMTFKNSLETKHMSVNGRPVYDKEGNIKFIVISCRDITKDIEAQRTMEQQKKLLEAAMEMKDEFLSLISHEFRTPLNVINTALQAINFLCEKDLTERLNRYLNTIRQNTFRQLRLVNNLLDITRANAGRIKIHKKNLDVVFLTNSIVHSVQPFASQKGVMVTAIPSIEKKVMGIDEEKYERILLNLLSNAIKFTPTDNLITVRIRPMKNKVCIDVKDDGIGIPEDKMDIIFEKFGQVDSSLSRQAEGSGIGLSLVKKLVEAMDGSISVKSKPGKGSTFTVTLPDELVLEERDISLRADLIDNRLVQVTNVEFSDIYL